jgi:hypothetical protein
LRSAPLECRGLGNSWPVDKTARQGVPGSALAAPCRQ